MEKQHGMANQSYYKINSKAAESNLADYSVDLSVNCCGEAIIRAPWGHANPRARRDFYLIYSLGSDIVGSIDGSPVSIGAGEVVCIREGTPFLLGSLEPMTEWTHYFWIHFTGREAENTVERSGIELNRVYSLGRCDEVFAYYERLFSEFRTQSANFEYSAALQLRYILYILGQARKEREVGRLDKSIRYIHTHLRYELSVEELAAKEFLGVSRYRELFRSITGVSPSEYITRLRIERAKDLLTQTDMTVAEVGEAVGYETRHYFQTVFRQRIGITPREYRTASLGK